MASKETDDIGPCFIAGVLIGAAVGLAANALFGTVKYRQTLPVLGALVGGILDLGVGIVRKLFSKR